MNYSNRQKYSKLKLSFSLLFLFLLFLISIFFLSSLFFLSSSLDSSKYAHFVFKTFSSTAGQKGRLNFEVRTEFALYQQCIKCSNFFPRFFPRIFQQFIIMLSNLSRGDLMDKIRWIFNLYDIEGNGFITKDEMVTIVQSIYDLMGDRTFPLISNCSASVHVDKIFSVRIELRICCLNFFIFLYFFLLSFFLLSFNFIFSRFLSFFVLFFSSFFLFPSSSMRMKITPNALFLSRNLHEVNFNRTFSDKNQFCKSSVWFFPEF